MMDKTPKILVVDDEQDLREILSFNLSSEGFHIDSVPSAEDALSMPLENYDLILLDVMMGGISGYRMADIIRKEKKLDIPIIFLTAKGEENDLLTGFNVGGDDYISKPFSIKEVVVRIRAVLKRRYSGLTKDKILIHKKLKIDLDKKTALIDKKVIELTGKEYKILSLLVKNKGKYISRDEILDNVWSSDVIVTDRNVDVNIARVRKKIGKYGANIKGKTGYGYCFQDETS
jgi:two-component system, OmpR family, alkaline phosphatase synthesis response regulator PhoP